MEVRVKICGLTRPQDAILAEELGADAIGVVVFSDSPRNVSAERAEEIFSSVGPFLSTVAVTHTGSAMNLLRILALNPDAIQISHGFSGVQNVKIIRVLTPSDPLRADCNAVVIDGSRGKGIPFDWEYARQTIQNSTVPVILAGGLDPSNVREAIDYLRPYAVDVASGVESAPGIKDPEKMEKFLRAVRDREDL
ncbi:MAG: phosphoribosylanthranilate isomerase [Methanomicrobiales archaeon]|nr:phosphoribosylanthranilate isomerase [Methanomicrobiales archaeon]